MFIIIIVVLGIIFYLAQLNSRISSLEEKLKNNLLIKSEIKPEIKTPEVVQEVTKEYVSEIKSDFIRKAPEVHQDTFAKNLAKFGISILIIGVIFFLKYIDSQGWIGPVFKYTSGLITGVVMLGIAEYLKNKNKNYSNLLRGGSFVIMYVTLFVGNILFHIVSLPVTLLLISMVLAISAIISLKENDSLPFTFGVGGSYITSFSLMAGSFVYSDLDVNKTNFISILSFILILNTAIIFISMYKNWIKNVVIGFVFTWLIFINIFTNNFDKNILFIFSTLYALQYLIIFLIQDFKNSKEKVFEMVESTVFLTVINTLVYIVLFYQLVAKTVLFDYIGFFVVLLGIFHFVIYMILKSIKSEDSGNVITLTHFVISILLISASVPLQFDGPIVTMLWFVEGIVLSFLSVLKDFKDKSIMYALGFIAIVAGIIHMIAFGEYESVYKTGMIFLNQKYIVWFAVFALINLIAYIWRNTVDDSLKPDFKNDINKIAFVLVIIGQIMFVALTSIEINEFGSYRHKLINEEVQKERQLAIELRDQYEDRYDYDLNYSERFEQRQSVSRETTFMQMLLFILMTVIYFIAGLVKKNKVVRNMGILTLIITSILLVTLTWDLGPVYRIITFVGFGILLLIVSYLYISKNKKHDITQALMMFLIIGVLSIGINANAKVVDINNWTSISNIKDSEITVQNNIDNQGLYILPIDKDVVTLSKKNDLSDIRIIDKSKNEIPYILVKSNQNTQEINQERINAKILENSTTRDNKKVIVLDTGREGLLYNKIFFSHDNKSINFRKIVKIYVSDVFLTSSSLSWSEIDQKSVVYNYTDLENFSVEKMYVDLMGISSRYVKLELIDDIEFDKNIKTNNKLNINTVNIEYIKNEKNDIGFKVKDYLSGKFAFDNLSILKDIKLIDSLQRDNRSELIFDGEIDVEEIILKVSESDEIFKRNLVVQGSNDDINWSSISSDNIYRVKSPTYKGEKLSIKIPVSTYKKFKIIIQDDNNKPLNIAKTAQVKIQNTAVLFRLENGLKISDLQLVVGNNIEMSPIYDIKQVINYFEDVTPKIIKYNTILDNPEYKPAKSIIPFGERNKVYLNIGLLIFIVIIGIFGFFWMRKDKIHE